MVPRYEVRVRKKTAMNSEYQIWQLPTAAPSRLSTAVCMARLHGRNLELVEHRVLKQLSGEGVHLKNLQQGTTSGHEISEQTALTLGLLFRALAPMRNRDKMRSVAEGIATMEGVETAYWLGMAMHRRYPRRVLMALRFLLTEP